MVAVQRLYAPVRKWTPAPTLPVDLNPDRDSPTVLQSADWTCSCASMAWVMNALRVPSPDGGAWNEFHAVNELRRITGVYGAVTPEYGLAYGNGSQLEQVYRAYGFEVSRVPGVDWWAAAGMSSNFIGQFGGGRWYHWTAVRSFDGQVFQLANPAPSWRGVGQDLDPTEWALWGGWTAVWVTGEG
jgi:hypothetical protein